MPKLAISVAEPTGSLEAIKLVRAVTGGSIDGIRNQLARGRAGVLFSAPLYMNDHPAVADSVRKLIHGLRALRMDPFIVEIHDDMAWSEVAADEWEDYRVGADDVLALLEEADGRFQ